MSRATSSVSLTLSSGTSLENVNRWKLSWKNDDARSAHLPCELASTTTKHTQTRIGYTRDLQRQCGVTDGPDEGPTKTAILRGGEGVNHNY